MITLKIFIIIGMILAVYAGFDCAKLMIMLMRRAYIIDIATEAFSLQKIKEEERKLEIEKEKKLQLARKFEMDVYIGHGQAYGGFCATNDDGSIKKDKVSLDKILMYGNSPGGKEYNYYIDEPNMVLLATDDADTLLLRSENVYFNIRMEGQSRGEGKTVKYATIRQGVVYYVILESKHEILIKATKAC